MASIMMNHRFHRAARDGTVDTLKEATRKDCNTRDDHGMTPTLYAAFHGQLEALRVLCGRGGDPDKADPSGNTTLHLSAAQGHKHVVTFLVNFGANIYSLNANRQTAQELAALNNRDDILRYLDGVHAKMEASDKKKMKILKEKARKEYGRRLKQAGKMQKKCDRDMGTINRAKMVKGPRYMLETLKFRLKSNSMNNLNIVGTSPSLTTKNTFSAIVGNGTISGNPRHGTVLRRVIKNEEMSNKATVEIDRDLKICDTEDSKRTVRSLEGCCKNFDAIYVSKDSCRNYHTDAPGSDLGADGKDRTCNSTFSSNAKLTRSISQPDILAEERNHYNSRTFQNNASDQLCTESPTSNVSLSRRNMISTADGFFEGGSEVPHENSSLGSSECYVPRTTDLSIGDEFSGYSEEEGCAGPLERFLTTWGLSEYLFQFEEQKVDLETLMILTDSDLKSLNLPLGPYRKLVTAIAERKLAFENPGDVIDSML